MSNTITTVNEVVTRRISQLQTEIATSEANLSSYRAEMELLLKVTQVTKVDIKSPDPVTAPITEPVPSTEPVPPTETGEDIIPSRRWSYLRLPERLNRFIDQFAPKGIVTREEINAWYERVLSPGIQRNSLMNASLGITKTLVAHEVLKALDSNRWQFNVSHPHPNQQYNSLRPHRLPPRYHRMIKYFKSKSFTRKDIAAWYRRAVNPKILDQSLAVEISKMTRFLSAQGIITRHGEDSWKVVP